MSAPYLSWQETQLPNATPSQIDELYDKGFLATRLGRNIFSQTRSIRVNLSKFMPSSENRRILKKTEGLLLTTQPIPYPEYQWSIGKLGKDFYTEKFGDGTFSANKIKELLTDSTKSSFNKLYTYSLPGIPEPIGYCITLETQSAVHYCYPFYQLPTTNNAQLPPNLGLGMMLRAIIFAQEQGKKYLYLGSAQRPSDTYKLQFAGLEWFDGKEWHTDLETLKNILAK